MRIVISLFMALLLTGAYSCAPKLKCSKFYTYNTRTVNLKGISSKLQKAGVQFADIGIAEIKIEPKYVVASEELQKLDLLQYTLCAQIRGLPKEDSLRQSIVHKYANTLVGMMNIAKNPDSLLANRVSKLEADESVRLARENELVRLKNTIPQVDADLEKANDNIRIRITVLNDVPIYPNFYITKFETNELIGGNLIERKAIYPSDNNRIFNTQGWVKFNDPNLLKDSISKITLHFSYESIFYGELMNAALKGKFTKNYIVNSTKQAIEKF